MERAMITMSRRIILVYWVDWLTWTKAEIELIHWVIEFGGRSEIRTIASFALDMIHTQATVAMLY